MSLVYYNTGHQARQQLFASDLSVSILFPLTFHALSYQFLTFHALFMSFHIIFNPFHVILQLQFPFPRVRIYLYKWVVAQI